MPQGMNGKPLPSTLSWENCVKGPHDLESTWWHTIATIFFLLLQKHLSFWALMGATFPRQGRAVPTCQGIVARTLPMGVRGLQSSSPLIVANGWGAGACLRGVPFVQPVSQLTGALASRQFAALGCGKLHEPYANTSRIPVLLFLMLKESQLPTQWHLKHTSLQQYPCGSGQEVKLQQLSCNSAVLILPSELLPRCQVFFLFKRLANCYQELVL